MTPESLLSIENLHLSFIQEGREVPLLKGVNIHLNSNESIGLVGESGSGKTMTALSILRLLDEDHAHYPKGSIMYSGRDLLRAREKELNAIRGNDIGVVFQEPSAAFNPNKICGDQILEAYTIHHPAQRDKGKELVYHLLDKVNLDNGQRYYHAYPHQLSGGELQRMMIVLALINKPKILLADEPTTALDVTVQKEILDLLKKLREEFQLATILISHDLNVIKEMVDRIYIMKDGTIIESGTTEEIFSRPKQAYTRGLIRCHPSIYQRYRYLPTIEDMSKEGIENKEDREIPSVESETELEERVSSIKNNPAILHVKNLSKTYTKRKSIFDKKEKPLNALDDVSFSLRVGEVLGIIGESGSGKSTLAKSLVSLIKIQSGEIIFTGKFHSNHTSVEIKEMRSEVQMIFQDSYASLNPKHTIGETIQEALDYYADKIEKKNTLDHWLQVVGLDHSFRHRYPQQLSGGQRQRVAIARALCVQPSVLICDEIVTALDVSIQAKILNLLKSIMCKTSLSMIFISHDLAIINQICDYILVMKEGVVVEYGRVDDIIHSPQQDYTRLLIDAASF